MVNRSRAGCRGMRARAAWLVLAGVAVGSPGFTEEPAQPAAAQRSAVPAAQPGPVLQPPPRLEPGQVLDLRLGDIRRYLPSNQWSAPLPEQLEDVEVVGRRGPPDMVETRPVPGGLGALFFAARHPTQLWRIFVPDPNQQLPEEDRRND